MTEPENEEDCTIPSRPPTEVLRKYVLDQDEYEAADVVNYINGQAPDETVEHLELVKREVALGQTYDIWDVTTDHGRWWVITNMTNLYSQEHFPSLDYLISFHIGLMARIVERSKAPRSQKQIQFGELDRRQQEIHDVYDRAVEAVDFQNIGLRVRETLLHLILAMSEFVELPAGEERPKKGDFKRWSALLSQILLPGSANQALRKYVRECGHEAWELANWLTHAKNAECMGALISMQSLDMTVGNFLFALTFNESEALESCPDCKSRNIRTHFDVNIGEDGEYFNSCGACGWNSRPTR